MSSDPGPSSTGEFTDSVNSSQVKQKDQHLEKGINLVSKAIEFDKCKNCREALQLYKDGLQSLMNSIKYEERNAKAKDLIKRKCREYVDRATLIKNKLENNQEVEETSVDPHIDDAQRKVTEMFESVVWCTPSVKFDDVIGLDDVKNKLKEHIILPLRYPELFKGVRRNPGRCLLFGPPGTGKTLMAKAVGTEAGVKCLFMSAESILFRSSDPEKFIKTMFTYARENKPALIFIDEIDSLGNSDPDSEFMETRSRRVRTEFLVQLEGMGVGNEGIYAFAATNKPWALNPAFRKRFCYRDYFPLPNQQDRSRMMEAFLKCNEIHHSFKEKDFEIFGEKSDGYTGSDILQVVQEIKLQLLREAQRSLYFRKIKCDEYPSKQTETGQSLFETQKGQEKCGASSDGMEIAEGDNVQQCPQIETIVTPSSVSSHGKSVDQSSTNLQDIKAGMTCIALAPAANSSAENVILEQNTNEKVPERIILSADSSNINTVSTEAIQCEEICNMNSLSPGNAHHHGDNYIPCSPDTPGAVKLNSAEIIDKLVFPPLTLDQVLNSLSKVKPTVEKRDIEKNLQFKRDFVDL